MEKSRSNSRIHLKLMTVEAFGEVVKWHRNSNKDFLRQWSGVGYRYPVTEKQFKARLKKDINKPRGSTFVYGVYNREEVLVGTVELSGIDSEKKVATLCRFLIKEEERNKGIGAEVIRELLTMAYKKFGVKMVFLKVYDFNKSAIHCYEKYGFETIKKERHVYRSENGLWNRLTMVYIIS